MIATRKVYSASFCRGGGQMPEGVIISIVILILIAVFH